MMKAMVGDQYIGGRQARRHDPQRRGRGLDPHLEHDGWRRHGFTHIGAGSASPPDGQSLVGEDALARTRGKREVAYALRFHLHPQAKPTLAPDGLSVEIRLANREPLALRGGWRRPSRSRRA